MGNGKENDHFDDVLKTLIKHSEVVDVTQNSLCSQKILSKICISLKCCCLAMPEGEYGDSASGNRASRLKSSHGTNVQICSCSLIILDDTDGLMVEWNGDNSPLEDA
ncbi:hypothetical protein LOAG_08853 [Loa loa]|uniref:Uncharacterized protein n=1 Tax=Loa loa TaxID=7209 RepID=A0A1S0TUK7_LOALO|nr:hypothetical protein LOAG_08853 [Loa loa]EFO19642.1 hypothetical protein LOAG_08853 [Loa loa]